MAATHFRDAHESAQRLESIGRLATGVAHDLSNALAPVMMATELLRLEFPHSASRYLDIVQSGTRRGADMARQLLAFAKGTEGQRLPLQPRHLLREMEKLIRATFPANIHLQADFEPNLQTVLGDATRLHQVLLNLCVNARDAMPKGGTLTLKAQNVRIDKLYARVIPEARPGHFVVWTVQDSGTGIPEEVLDRIFEPFFTTKDPDRGTGLGLATVMEIVRSHGGFISVYSVAGRGSIFSVYLPALGLEDQTDHASAPAVEPFRGRGETILVVDDEAEVREVTKAVLLGLNFKVLTAADGREALQHLGRIPANVGAVITDAHMPGMDGLAFVRHLRAKAPLAGIIVASGRLEEEDYVEFRKLGVRETLEKPFTQATLLGALRAVLEG